MESKWLKLKQMGGQYKQRDVMKYISKGEGGGYSFQSNDRPLQSTATAMMFGPRLMIHQICLVEDNLDLVLVSSESFYAAPELV